MATNKLEIVKSKTSRKPTESVKLSFENCFEMHQKGQQTQVAAQFPMLRATGSQSTCRVFIVHLQAAQSVRAPPAVVGLSNLNKLT